MISPFTKEFWIKLGAGVVAVASAIFYVLFKEKKENRLEAEKRELERQAEQLRENAEALAQQSDGIKDAIEKTNEARKENEEKINSIAGNDLNSFNSAINILSNK